MLNAIFIYRIAKKLNKMRIPYLPLCLDYLNRFIFACWVPHTADLGESLILGYGGLAVVIHGQAKIGNNVHIDQCVTIGGNGTQFGVPVIGDNVYIGAGAKVLGPIKIGDNSVIGANAVVIKDVPQKSVVAGIPAKIVKENINPDTFLYHQKIKNLLKNS